MRAIPSTPTSTPLVGVSILVNPSPNWKASTVVWRDTSIRSATWVIIGIVRAALAEPLGITTLSNVWKRYMAANDSTSPLRANDRVSP